PLAAAIITVARIALGIFVRQHRALCFEHGFGDDIFGGDEFDFVPLTTELTLHRAEYFGVALFERGGEKAVRIVAIRHRIGRGHSALLASRVMNGCRPNIADPQKEAWA